MKKVILIVLLLFVLFFVVLFSASEEDALAEKSIDGVAAYLGYFEGEDIDLYTDEEEMYGALAGKYFRDGQVSIYEFDPDSPSYKYWESETDTCVGGFVLLYDNTEELTEVTEDEMFKEVEKIKSIKFKPDED